MKVSRIILALIASAIVATSYAESNDSVKLVRLEQTLQKEIKARESLKTELAIQKDLIKNQAGVIDSLRSAIDQNARNIKTAALGGTFLLLLIGNYSVISNDRDSSGVLAVECAVRSDCFRFRKIIGFDDLL